MNNEDVIIETKQERRERKLQKKKEQMQKHGKSTARIYIDALFKRLKHKKK
ncbi:MAG: hypothetical protein PHE15_02555 [Dehalococcoidales bacterium]|jgi:hypothetical protein|nr:hypothetical protein [Dehalococcoidales bacterium]